MDTGFNRRGPPIAAIILAAGYSSRMGCLKPLLPLSGRPAIERSVQAFCDGGAGPVLVVTGHRAEALEPVLDGLCAITVHNANFDAGMYSSVKAGIAALPPAVEASFLLPADTPLVHAATVATLATAYAVQPCAVLYPTFAGARGHPPLISRRLFAEILSGDGEGGLSALLARHEDEAAEVDVPDQGILLDMDVPYDYARLAAVARMPSAPTVAECEAILAAHETTDRVRRHGRAVAAVAQALAQRLPRVDPDVVTAAGLLHDMVRERPNHAQAGSAIIAAFGYPAVATAMAHHMDLEFTGCNADAAAVVFLADKLVREDRRVSLQERFAPALERFAGQPEALAGATRRYNSAQAVAAAIEAQSGASIDELLAGCGVLA
jgi:CTP:molybdopterin cytidylyltransferase MocA